MHTADFGDANCIRNMTQKHQQVRLRLGRNAWLAIIILAVALYGTTAQSALARCRRQEIHDAAIRRDFAYKRTTASALTLDHSWPHHHSGPLLVTLGVQGQP